MDSPSHRYHFESERPADAKASATRGEPEFDLLLQQKKEACLYDWPALGKIRTRMKTDERESQEHRVCNCVTHRSRMIEKRNDRSFTDEWIDLSVLETRQYFDWHTTLRIIWFDLRSYTIVMDLQSRIELHKLIIQNFNCFRVYFSWWDANQFLITHKLLSIDQQNWIKKQKSFFSVWLTREKLPAD